MPNTSRTENNEEFSTEGSSPSQIRQLLWEGLPGVYMAAADGGLLKTIDYGAGWGSMRPNTEFGTTWPAGAVGYQMATAIGPRQCDDGVFITLRDRIYGSGTHIIFNIPDPGTGTWLLFLVVHSITINGDINLNNISGDITWNFLSVSNNTIDSSNNTKSVQNCYWGVMTGGSGPASVDAAWDNDPTGHQEIIEVDVYAALGMKTADPIANWDADRRITDIPMTLDVSPFTQPDSVALLIVTHTDEITEVLNMDPQLKRVNKDLNTINNAYELDGDPGSIDFTIILDDFPVGSSYHAILIEVERI